MTLETAKSNHDQAVVDMQYSLVAYSKVVMKRVTDVVAMGVRFMLVNEVGMKIMPQNKHIDPKMMCACRSIYLQTFIALSLRFLI